MFLVLAGACGWFVYRRAPWSSAAASGGAGGGLVLLIALAWFGAIPGRVAEWARIVGTRFGREPRDGQPSAIVGTLAAQGMLTAPFSREPCVLYSYEVVTRDIVDGESSERKAYEGFAMVPLWLEHGTERTRILARPGLPGLRSIQRKSRTAEANAKSFVESTTFAPASAKRAETVDLSHTGGHLRHDYRREPIETNMGACRLEETLLAAGTPICALGTYRADLRALMAPVTLRTGKSFGVDAAWRVVNAGIGGASFLAIAIIALAIFCAHYPIDRVEQLHPEWQLAWWEVDLERFVEKHVRPPMLAFGMLDSPGFYLQEVCEGCAKGRLEIGGRTMDLRYATYIGGKAVHLSAHPGDRDGVTLDGRAHVVLTVDGKQADVPPSWLQKNDIQTSLGSHGEYEGRVTVIAPDRSIRCRVSFNTHVDADAWLPGALSR
jgi:hypothetical protein